MDYLPGHQIVPTHMDGKRLRAVVSPLDILYVTCGNFKLNYLHLFIFRARSTFSGVMGNSVKRIPTAS